MSSSASWPIFFLLNTAVQHRIIEMQAILVELIEQFEFTIPEDKPEIIRFPAGLVAPLVKDDMKAGPQMPLRVTLTQ